jgi:hypothetical protein
MTFTFSAGIEVALAGAIEGGGTCSAALEWPSSLPKKGDVAPDCGDDRDSVEPPEAVTASPRTPDNSKTR